MKLSVIIASRNRSESLARTLRKLDLREFREFSAELVVVDNASTDGTLNMLEDFRAAADVDMIVGRTEATGQHVAQNEGVRLSSGDLLSFTDDDCYLGEGYIKSLLANFDPARFQYGAGNILRYDPEDDPRVAATEGWPRSGMKLIPPHVLIPPGTVQGANMFYMRSVLEKIRGFDESIGAGKQFVGGDCDTAARASAAGFAGACLFDVVVYHHHGRRRGSPKAQAVVDSYGYARGAYYASLMAAGYSDALPMWMRWLDTVMRNNKRDEAIRSIQLEMAGAADYLKLKS